MATPADSAQILGLPRRARQAGSRPDGQSALPRHANSPYQVDTAMRVLPSHGWSAGWTGRRDRALLVLSHMAGLSFENIAALTVEDITVRDGVATIRTPGGMTRLQRDEDDLICGPCALARWLHTLDMTTLYDDHRVIAAVIARAAPLTADSPHMCLGTISVAEATRRMTLLPTPDLWGECGGSRPRAQSKQSTRMGVSVDSTGVDKTTIIDQTDVGNKTTAGRKAPAGNKIIAGHKTLAGNKTATGTATVTSGVRTTTVVRARTDRMNVGGPIRSAATRIDVIDVTAEPAMDAKPLTLSRYAVSDITGQVAQVESVALVLEGRARQLLDARSDAPVNTAV